MPLRIIYGRAGTGKTNYCVKEIKKRIDNKEDNKYILIVPEQFTFQTENRLLNEIGEKSVLNAEVLSFKRIAHRIFNNCGGLTKRVIKDAGKNMLIYKVLEELSDKMKAFGVASKKDGFIDIISTLISELKKYEVTNESLDIMIDEVEDLVLKEKLKDIREILNNFNLKLHKSYIDGEDQLTMALEYFKDCDLYKDSEVWIDEFNTFTPQQMNIILELIKRAKIVNITLPMDERNGRVKDIDLFNTTKNTEKRLIRALEENNLSFKGYIGLNEDVPYRFKENKELAHLEKQFYAYPFNSFEESQKNLRLYKANNSYDELEFIAKDITRLVRECNYRFKNISLICRNIEDYEKITSVIFEQYEIPYYIDKKLDVASNPLVILINSAIDIVNKNWSYESVFKYLKSGLIGIDKDLIDRLENYILAYGIKGTKWKEEEWNYYSSSSFKNSEITEKQIKELNDINEIKHYVEEPLLKLERNSKGKKTVREFSTILYEFLDEDLKVLDKIEEKIKFFEDIKLASKVKEYSTIMDILVEVLEQCVDILGDEKVDLKEFSRIINVGFSKYEMGVVPVAIDQVNVGDISRIKSRGAKAIYIVGINDGVLPAVNKEEGILSDRDRNNLKERGIQLASDTKTKVFEEQFLVYTALTIAEDYLVLTYPLADFEGKALRPSIIIHRMKKIFPQLKEESYGYNLSAKRDKLYDITAKSPTFNNLIMAIRRDFDNEDVDKYWGDVYNYFMENKQWERKLNNAIKGLKYSNLDSISSEKVKQLYANDYGKFQFSVSKLERYAQCPFAYYVQYGLKAKDRKIYEFSAPDLGSFMHEILDEFTNEVKEKSIAWSELNQEKCRDIINLLVNKQIEENKGSILNSSHRYKYFTDRFKRILTKSVMVITEQMKKSSFEVFQNEFEFGGKKPEDQIKINLPSGEEVYLTGRIDRIDKLNLEGKQYLRIIDYKSGTQNFDLNKLFNGLQIQLLIYLDILLKNSEKIIGEQAFPGAMLYFKIDDPIIKSKKELTEEEVKEEVLKELKLDGLMLNDVEVIKSMDNDINEGGFSLIIPARLKKDGSLSKSKSLITEEQFDLIRAYVNKKVIDISELMLSGNIDIEPCKEGENSFCDYCSYSHICQFDLSIENNCYKHIRKEKEEKLWDKIEEKVNQ
ncbi:MAG: helicase-exonuclease AddAB subunit AddB [Sarcina sp.]